MLLTAAFKGLLATWNATSYPRPKSFDFYLSHWYNRLLTATSEFQQELADNLLNTDELGARRYLHYLRQHLDDRLVAIASLSTAAPTNLLAVVQQQQEFVHSAYYQEVEQALADRGIYSATPNYDDEDATIPFQNEASQTSFLQVSRLVDRKLLELNAAHGATVGESVVPAIRWKKDIADLLDLLLTLEEQGHLEIQWELGATKISQALATAIKLPKTKGAANTSDAERLLTYFAKRDDEKVPGSKERKIIYANRAKQSYYTKIENVKRKRIHNESK